MDDVSLSCAGRLFIGNKRRRYPADVEREIGNERYRPHLLAEEAAADRHSIHGSSSFCRESSGRRTYKTTRNPISLIESTTTKKLMVSVRCSLPSVALPAHDPRTATPPAAEVIDTAVMRTHADRI